MDKMVIIGGGGHSKVIVSVIKKLNNINIIGYTDIEDRGYLLDIPFLGNDETLGEIIKNNPDVAAAIGIGMLDIKNIKQRKKLIDLAITLGYKFPPIISPDSFINEAVSIGNGTTVMDAVVVNSGTFIGKFCILNTSCSIDHDCEVGDYCHVAPGARISGGVKIDKNVFVGAGSVIIQYINISSGTIIGAGSVVIHDIKTPGVYAGNPAKLIS